MTTTREEHHVCTQPPPLPVEAVPEPILVTGPTPSVPGLAELVLKDQRRLDALLRDPARQPELVSRLLALALCGFTLFGLGAGVLAAFVRATWSFLPSGAADVGPLVAAYDVGLVAAIGVCLPSFYFYGLLAGIRPTMLETTVHAIKALAVTSVALVGLLPLGFVAALGVVVLGADRDAHDLVMLLLVLLPFGAGFVGLRSLYRGFTALAADMPAELRQRRGCFLRRLIAMWGGVYAAVGPLMVWTLWNAFRP